MSTSDLEAFLRKSENPVIKQVVGGVDNLPDLAEATFYIGVLAQAQDVSIRLDTATQLTGVFLRNGFPEKPEDFSKEQAKIVKTMTLTTLGGNVASAFVLLGLVSNYFTTLAEAEDAAVSTVEDQG